MTDELNIGLYTAGEIINDMENRSEEWGTETCENEIRRHGKFNKRFQKITNGSYRMY